MKNRTIFTEFLLSLLLLVSLVALFDPLNFFMFTMTQVFVLCTVVSIFCAYVLFLFREKIHDEREEQHRFLASRSAFFFGATTLLVSIIIEKLNHQPVKWLVLSLGMMVIGKLVGHVYAGLKR